MSGETLPGWSEIYERLARRRDRPDPLAWAALERRVQAWARDDDLAAEVCAEVWRTFNLTRGGPAFEGFVQGRFLEVARRMPPPPSPLPLARERGNPVVSDDSPPTTGTPARGERLAACLEELRARNPRHHQALSMVYEDRATVAEAADVRAVDAWTVRSLAARARVALAQCLDRAERRRAAGVGDRAGAADGARSRPARSKLTRSGGRPRRGGDQTPRGRQR